MDYKKIDAKIDQWVEEINDVDDNPIRSNRFHILCAFIIIGVAFYYILKLIVFCLEYAIDEIYTYFNA